MLKLLSVRAISEPLSNWVGDMKLTGLGAASANEGAVQSVHVVRRPPKVQLQRDRDKPAESDAFDMVSVGRQAEQAIGGRQGKEARAPTHRSRSGRACSDGSGKNVFANSVSARLGPRSLSFALVVDTARLGGEPPAGKRDAFVLRTAKIAESNRCALLFRSTCPASVLTSYSSPVGALLGEPLGPRARLASHVSSSGTTKSVLLDRLPVVLGRATWRSIFSERASHLHSHADGAPSSRQAEHVEFPMAGELPRTFRDLMRANAAPWTFGLSGAEFR